MVKITKEAAEKFNEVKEKAKNTESTMLRVYLGGAGCGSAKLKLTLVESKSKHDIVVESNGVKIIYDSEIEEYVNGTIIDYACNELNQGFVIG